MMTPGFKSVETNKTLQRPIKKNQVMTIKKSDLKVCIFFSFFNLKILPQGQAWKQLGYRDHHYQNHFRCNSFLLAFDFIHYELLLEILILTELVKTLGRLS